MPQYKTSVFVQFEQSSFETVMTTFSNINSGTLLDIRENKAVSNLITVKYKLVQYTFF